MSGYLVRSVKAVLPTAIFVPLRTYVVRLLVWTSIVRTMRGTKVRDAFWLWLSFLVSPVTAATRLREWRDPVLLRDVVVDVRDIGRFSLRARTDDLWHVTPRREPAILACIRERLSPGDCFVDAGANIGFYSVVAARQVGPGGTVIAVEMMKPTAALLRRNLSLNRAETVRVVENALAERDGEVLFASMPSGSYGQASLRFAQGDERFEVLTTTLDTVLADVSSIKLLKMDLEGAEFGALQGALTALDRIEAIIFEHLRGSAYEPLEGFLLERGFRIESLGGNDSLAVRRGADARSRVELG